jgi:hypothetical protein
MRCGLGTGAKLALQHGEGLIEDDAARTHGRAQRRKEVAVQIPRHQQNIEAGPRQRRRREIGAPQPDREARGVRAPAGGRERLRIDVDAERRETRSRKRQRVAPAAAREIERAARRRHETRDARHPLGDEPRRQLVYDPGLAQALLTAVVIGLLGLLSAVVLGLRGSDVGLHISFGIFSTLVTLLAHSMMMFYLIGKGKAVKDAMAEGGLSGDQYRRFAAARKPVFSYGTVAMAATMIAAILGASVDTGVLPAVVHGMIAYGAIACNLAAMKIDLSALAESSRIVDEVNRLLGA